jgi:hypothetical protein
MEAEHAEVVEMSEMPATPEAGSKTAMARWKTGASTRNAPPRAGGAVYGLGMIGALVYFLGSAGSATDRVLAFPKAAVWPALLVYRLFKSLGG